MKTTTELINGCRFTFRPETTDRRLILEGWHEYKTLLPFIDKATVLDVGAHLGGFTQYAAQHGARAVHAYEPDTQNFELLSQNVGTNKSVYLHRAAVNTVKGTCDFYAADLGKNRSAGRGSLIPTRGRIKYQVEQVDLATLLQLPSPLVLKMDCEGWEWKLLKY